MKMDNWKNNLARDLIAIGGIPFFILVLIRVWMLNNPQYFMQFAVSGILFGGLFYFFKQDTYSGLGLIILIFTSLYYKDVLYSIFGGVTYVLMLGCLMYIGRNWKNIGLGILFGIFCIAISFIYPYL